MSFETQSDAKRFFVDKVVEQAGREGVPLSPAVRHMLSWSESDPDFEPDAALLEAQENEIPEKEFERLVSGLIRRAFTRDLAADRSNKALYRQAYAKLNEGDHYIVIMIDQAIGSKLKRWWQPRL